MHPQESLINGNMDSSTRIGMFQVITLGTNITPFPKTTVSSRCNDKKLVNNSMYGVKVFFDIPVKTRAYLVTTKHGVEGVYLLMSL